MISKKSCSSIIYFLQAILLTACSPYSSGEFDSPVPDEKFDNCENSNSIISYEVVSENPDPLTNAYLNDELNSILQKRENITTKEQAQKWREELNSYWDKYDQENLITNSVTSLPVTLTAEYYSGEFQTGYEGDYNNNIDIELTFTVKLDQTVYYRGDRVTLRIDAQNIGSPFMYVPHYSSPDAFLRHEEYTNGKSYSKGYTTYSIYRGDIIIPEGILSEEVCETGSTWSNIVEINVPENAMTGLYDIIVFSHGYAMIAKDAVEIIY